MEEIRLGSDAHGYTTEGFLGNEEFEARTLYEAEKRWNKNDLIGVINEEQPRIINHLGHAGWKGGLGIHKKDLKELKNERYFFAYSQGCMSGYFDYGGEKCFAEKITVMENGAAAVVMNAQEGLSNEYTTDFPSQRLNRSFCHAVLEEEIYRLGEIVSYSKVFHAPEIGEMDMRWCMYGLNLFGDPALRISNPSPRASISIKGDGSFETATEWVSGGGTGRENDPYLIENHHLDASETNGIWIEDTEKHFIIRNCLIENGGELYQGIHLENVANGTLENNTFENNRYGVKISNSNNCRPSGNNLDGNLYNFSVEGSKTSHFDHEITTSNLINGRPIYYLTDNSNQTIGKEQNPSYVGLVKCENIKVRNLNLEKNGQGILIASGENIQVENCNFLKNLEGIHLDITENSKLRGNTSAKNADEGIYLEESSNNILERNFCENNRGEGIYLNSSRGNTLTGNISKNNYYSGVYLYSSESNSLENNIYSGSSSGIHLKSSDNNNLTGNEEKDCFIGAFLRHSSGCKINKNSFFTNQGRGIYLYSSSRNKVENNSCSKNSKEEIYVCRLSSQNTFKRNTCAGNLKDGITLSSSDNNALIGNLCENNSGIGILLTLSSHNDGIRNICRNNSDGIRLTSFSQNNLLDNNKCSNNKKGGINSEHSSLNEIVRNLCRNNKHGIRLNRASNYSLGSNVCENNRYNFSVEGSKTSHFDHEITTSNLINGRPIYYLTDNSNQTIGEKQNPGYVGLVKCENIQVRNIKLENNGQGIVIRSTEDSKVENCKFGNNQNEGIHISNSSRISLESSLFFSNTSGIQISSSENCTLNTNVCENNRYNFSVEGSKTSHFDHEITTSNLINGRPIYYLTDNSNQTIGEKQNPGYVGLVKCENIQVRSLNLEKNGQGILIASGENIQVENCLIENSETGIGTLHSSKNLLLGNVCSKNGKGIELFSSSQNNFLINNVASNNTTEGIRLYKSSKNVLENNKFEKNSEEGIYIHSSNSNTLIKNKFSGNYRGAYLHSSDLNNIEKNNFTGNSESGVYLYSSRKNTLIGNSFISNRLGTSARNSAKNTLENNTFSKNRVGIDIDSSNQNLITLNVCENNKERGVKLSSGSESNDLTRNILKNNRIGIQVEKSEKNRLIANLCRNNNDYGIYLSDSSSRNAIKNNSLRKNLTGVYIDNSSNNTLVRNICENNGEYGISISISSNNKISKNYFAKNRENNAYDDNHNYWSENAQGNYWGDWQPPEHGDRDNNGIVDEPKPISGENNLDMYPLVIKSYKKPTLKSPENSMALYEMNPTFSWTMMPEATSYCLLIYNDPNFEGEFSHYEESYTSSVEIKDELPPGRYYWKVCAIKDQEKTWSEEVFTLTVKEDNTPPSPFSLTHPENSEEVYEITPRLAWESSSDEGYGLSHYEIWLDEINIENIEGGRTGYSVFPLTKGNHNWFIVAVDVAGNSRRSGQTRDFRVSPEAKNAEYINPRTTKPGEVWFAPENQIIETGEQFSSEIRLNSGQKKLGAYKFIISYDINHLELVKSMGVDGIEEGEDGFTSAINAKIPGSIIVNGFNTTGTGPGENLHALTIHWKAKKSGSTALDLDASRLTDEMGVEIGSPIGIGAARTVFTSPETNGKGEAENPWIWVGIIIIMTSALGSLFYIKIRKPGARD